jgi:hypothetical protein
MVDPQTRPSETSRPQTLAMRRAIRQPLAVFGFTALAILAFTCHRSTRPLLLPDGHQVALIKVARQTSTGYIMGPGHHRVTEDQLLVSYYSNLADSDLVHAEARTLAAGFIRLADSLGVRTILVEPSKPLLLRSFPILTFAAVSQFTRTTSGAWHEQRWSLWP